MFVLLFHVHVFAEIIMAYYCVISTHAFTVIFITHVRLFLIVNECQRTTKSVQNFQRDRERGEGGRRE